MRPRHGKKHSDVWKLVCLLKSVVYGNHAWIRDFIDFLLIKIKKVPVKCCFFEFQFDLNGGDVGVDWKLTANPQKRTKPKSF